MNETITHYVIPFVILAAALSVAIGYKMLNRTATLNDPIEQECIKVAEKEIETIIA